MRNIGRQTAKGALVFLTGIKEVHPAGVTDTSFQDPMPLAWAGRSFEPRDVPNGISFFVNLVKISKHEPGCLLGVEKLFANRAMAVPK